MGYFIEILQVRWNQFSKVHIQSAIFFHIPYFLNPWAVPYPLDLPLGILITTVSTPLEFYFPSYYFLNLTEWPSLLYVSIYTYSVQFITRVSGHWINMQYIRQFPQWWNSGWLSQFYSWRKWSMAGQGSNHWYEVADESVAELWKVDLAIKHLCIFGELPSLSWAFKCFVG